MTQAITEEQGVHKDWYTDAGKQSLSTLPEFLRHLSEDYVHDYGTICHAVAAAGLAAAWAMNKAECGGITGFQAGAVMWQFIIEWQSYRDQPLRLVKYEEMLYPQYGYKFEKTITPETWEWLQKKARASLAERDGMSASAVEAHWRLIDAGVVPFGYIVAAD